MLRAARIRRVSRPSPRYIAVKQRWIARSKYNTRQRAVLRSIAVAWDRGFGILRLVLVLSGLFWYTSSIVQIARADLGLGTAGVLLQAYCSVVYATAFLVSLVQCTPLYILHQCYF